MTDEQACADWLERLPSTPPDDINDDADRYRLSEDDNLEAGAWTVSDGMVGPALWGFLVRAHPSVVRAVRVRWPQLTDNQRALALMVLVEDAE